MVVSILCIGTLYRSTSVELRDYCLLRRSESTSWHLRRNLGYSEAARHSCHTRLYTDAKLWKSYRIGYSVSLSVSFACPVDDPYSSAALPLTIPKFKASRSHFWIPSQTRLRYVQTGLIQSCSATLTSSLIASLWDRLWNPSPQLWSCL